MRFLWVHIVHPIPPNGKFKIVWDMISTLLIAYDLIILPYLISFDINSGDFVDAEENFENSFFLADILVNCHTSYIEEGIIIEDHKLIFLKYFKFWFWIDLFSSIPISWISGLISDDSGKGFQAFTILKFVRFTKLIKILRVVRLKSIMGKVRDLFHISETISGVLNALYLTMIIILLAHWAACAWHFIGNYLAELNEPCWILSSNSYNTDNMNKYIASLYWAFMTLLTVGYGEFTAISKGERIVGIIVTLTGCMLFGFTTNSISMIISNLNANKSKTRYNLKCH